MSGIPTASLALSLLVPSLAYGAGLEVYAPRVDTHAIYQDHPGKVPRLRYSHCVDMMRFKGRYVALWNANENQGESVPGQFIYLSVSDDLRRWTAPVRPFTRDGGAEHPVENDNQWQPALVNYRDEVLYCAWSTFTGGAMTYVSSSLDGTTWRTREVAPAPAGLEGQVVGFPTTRGMVTSRDVIMFPCSLPPLSSRNLGPAKTRYAAVLLSEDAGATWRWSRPAEAVTWTSVREKPEDHQKDDTIYLWEPSIFERRDGRLGMVLRNATWLQPDASPKPHHMVLATVSGDHGQTWGKAAPVQIESVSSRMCALTEGMGDGLAMVMNDMNAWIADRSYRDRLNLALFVAPVPDPDLLLPGPLVQPEGAPAYYPNAFVEDGRLCMAYTYNNAIYASVLHPLPDFSRPFLLPRGGRSGLAITGRMAHLRQRESTLGLVLAAEQIRRPDLAIRFRVKVDAYDGNQFTLLTLGGKTANGASLRVIYDAEAGADLLQIGSGGAWAVVGRLRQGEWAEVLVRFAGKSPDGRDSTLRVVVDGADAVALPGTILRKVAFGGLYVKPEWPRGMARSSEVLVDLDSIRIE